jgi:hypothetical protein
VARGGVREPDEVTIRQVHRAVGDVAARPAGGPSGQPGHRLPASRFADDAEAFTGIDMEADPVNRVRKTIAHPDPQGRR